MDFWEDEADLYQLAKSVIHSRRAELSRRVYNRELIERDPSYLNTLNEADFEMKHDQRYVTPTISSLSSTERWFVAIGFGLIALSVSILFEDLVGFSDTFDFAAILAAIIAVVFASDLNMSIRKALTRTTFLRWFIPLSGLILLVAALIVRFGGN